MGNDWVYALEPLIFDDGIEQVKRKLDNGSVKLSSEAVKSLAAGSAAISLKRIADSLEAFVKLRRGSDG